MRLEDVPGSVVVRGHAKCSQTLIIISVESTAGPQRHTVHRCSGGISQVRREHVQRVVVSIFHSPRPKMELVGRVHDAPQTGKVSILPRCVALPAFDAVDIAVVAVVVVAYIPASTVDDRVAKSGVQQGDHGL